MLSRDLGDGLQLWTTPLPLAASGVGALASAIVAVGLLGLAWKYGSKAPLQAAAVLLLVGVAATLPLAAPLLGWLLAPKLPTTTLDESALAALWPGAALETALWGLTAFSLAVGLAAAWLPRRPALALGGAALLALAALPGLAGPVHAGLLGFVGPVPAVELSGPRAVHLGRARALIPAQTGALLPWKMRSSPDFHAKEVGEFVQEIVLSRGVAQLRYTLSIQVGRELSHPALPLTVGNRWTWTRTTHRRDHFLWGMLSKREEHTSPAGTLEVVGAREVEGLRVFALRWSPTASADTEPSPPVAFEVYGMEGNTYILEDHSEFLSPLDAAGACTWALFPGATCDCAAAPASAAPLRAPTTCTQSNRGTGTALASGFFALVTGGLLIPDAGSDVTLLLTEAVAGRGQGAPAAPR